MESRATLMDARQVSKRLGVRLHRVYELIREGRLPCVRLGRQVRFDPNALEDFIASGGTKDRGQARTAEVDRNST
jgi:excisionase family DNA binding protein